MAQTVKRLSAMQETRVPSLGREDTLEKEMAAHSTVSLPGKSHGRRSLVGYCPWGSKESDTTEQFHFTSLQGNLGILRGRGTEAARDGGKGVQKIGVSANLL